MQNMTARQKEFDDHLRDVKSILDGIENDYVARDVEALEHRAGKMECILQEVRTLLVYAGVDDYVVTVVTGDDMRTVDAADIIGRIDELGIEVE